MNIPTQAVKGLLVKNGKILLLQRNIALRGVDNWDLPGGLMEENETPEATLIREVQEELGMEIKVVRLSHSWKFFRPKDEKWVDVQNYICEVISGEPILSEEHMAFEWISPNDIRKFPVKDESLYQAILNESL